MKITTFQGIVENGQVRLPDTVRLPEKAIGYVVVVDAGVPQASYTVVHPEKLEDFEEAQQENAQQLAQVYGANEPAYTEPDYKLRE